MIALGSFMGSFSFRDGSYCSSPHFLDTLFCTYTKKEEWTHPQKNPKRENNHQNTVFSRSLKSLLWRRHSLDRKVGPEHCTLLAFWARSGILLHLKVLGGILEERWRGRAGLGHLLFVV
jgi:hypothetical protein